MNPPGPLLVQGVAFAAAALTGVALGLTVDGYRALRGAVRPLGVWGHILDVGLVALALPVVAAGMLAANWGEVRVYPLLALALGATVYLTLGSPLLLPVAIWLVRGVVRLVGAVARAVVAPVVAAANAVRHLAQWAAARRGGSAASNRPPESDGEGAQGQAPPRANQSRAQSERGEGGRAVRTPGALRHHARHGADRGGARLRRGERSTAGRPRGGGRGRL